MSMFLELIDAVDCGKKVHINLVEKTVKINGNDINLDGELINITDMEYVRCNLTEPWEILEDLYANYKRSIPSATTRTNKSYFIADSVENLNENVVIHRITGDADKNELLAPTWTLKKFVVMNEIDKLMRKENYYQGDLYVQDC